MRKLKWTRLLSTLLIVSLTLAACGDDDDHDNNDHDADNGDSATATSGVPALDTGQNVGLGTGSQLPGCSDPDDSECPAPLVLELDGQASAGDMAVSYPTRYFTAATSVDGDIPIEITPSENHRFAEKATFQVYYADSVDAALAELSDPISAPWQTERFAEGTIGVVKDESQDPPVNTTIGAFALPDGRAVVLKAVTTGKYGWDLYTRLYEEMLNSLAVSS